VCCHHACTSRSLASCPRSATFCWSQLLWTHATGRYFDHSRIMASDFIHSICIAKGIEKKTTKSTLIRKMMACKLACRRATRKTAVVGVIDKLNFKVSTTSLANFRCSCLRRGGCVISKCSPFPRGLDLFTKFVCWPKRWIYSNIFSKAGEISCQGEIAWIKLWYLILPS